MLEKLKKYIYLGTQNITFDSAILDKTVAEEAFLLQQIENGGDESQEHTLQNIVSTLVLIDEIPKVRHAKSAIESYSPEEWNIAGNQISQLISFAIREKYYEILWYSLATLRENKLLLPTNVFHDLFKLSKNNLQLRYTVIELSGNRGQWIINHIDDHAWQYMKYVADEELFLRGDKNEKQEAFQRLCTSKGLNIALDLLLKNYATFNPALRLKFINIIHRFSLDEDGLQILTAIKKLEKSSHNIGILNSIIYRSHFSDEYEMINEWGRTMYDACVSAKKLYDLDFLHENYPVPDLNFQYGVDEEYLPLRNSIDQKRFFTAMTFINYEGWANHSDLKSFLKRISQELIVAISLSAIRYKNEVLGDILLREYMVAPTLILAVAPSRRYEYIDVLWSENDLQSNLLLMDLAFEENNAKLNPQLQKKILKWLFENELFIANNTIVEKCAIRIDMQTVVDIEKSLNQSNESRSIFAKIKQMVSEIKKLAC